MESKKFPVVGWTLVAFGGVDRVWPAKEYHIKIGFTAENLAIKHGIMGAFTLSIHVSCAKIVNMKEFYDFT